MKAFLCLVEALAAISCKNKETVIDTTQGIPPPLPEGVNPNIPPGANVDPDFVSFAREESDKLEVLQSASSAERLMTRFLTVCEQFNEGKKDLTNYVKAVDKTLNSLSTESRIEASNAGGATGCVRAFDMRDFGMTPAKWRSFERRLHETFGTTFESFTTRGLLIKQLTQSRQASVPAHIFAFLALNQPVYSDMLGLPGTEQELEFLLGVNIQRNFDDEDRDTHVACKTQSPISLTKPRCMLATESADGYYYKTYDILSGNIGQRATNPFESPFPVQARSQRTLIHDGSESIYSLPNGMQGYYLSDGDGVQVDVGPLDLVADPGAASRALSPEISYLSCHDCHARALEPFEDEVASKVDNDPTFNIIDRQKVQFWHGRPAALLAKTNKDKNQYFDALAKIRIGQNENDPINAYTNRLRQENTLEQVAALMSQTPQNFARSLRATRQAQAEFGQLLSGQTVTFEQLQRTIQIYVQEANIFRDNFGE